MSGKALLRAAGWLAAACAAGSLLHAGGGRSSRTRPAGTKGRIVFSSKRTGSWRIWVMNEDGSAVRRLTADAEGTHDVDPVFSPDGRRVLFTSTRGGRAGVWVMPLATTKPRRICDGDQAEWSPDGKAIVLRRKGRIVTRHLAAGRERTVSPEGWTACSAPSWSPDGKRIALALLKDGRNGLYVVPARGGKAVMLYDKEGACEPHWSPDGRRIVYETETHIATINADGTNNRLVTWFGGVQRYGRFSPDGRRIVFCQGVSPTGPWEIYVIPAAGGNPKRLTKGSSDMYPDWR